MGYYVNVNVSISNTYDTVYGQNKGTLYKLIFHTCSSLYYN